MAKLQNFPVAEEKPDAWELRDGKTKSARPKTIQSKGQQKGQSRFGRSEEDNNFLKEGENLDPSLRKKVTNLG